eukprot:3557350-Ditylum_brightwellii.AAC.1
MGEAPPRLHDDDDDDDDGDDGDWCKVACIISLITIFIISSCNTEEGGCADQRRCTGRRDYKRDVFA